ncbi:MAG: FAD-dependent oxidoreductase, partial [Pseudomonadota bacterium]
HATVDLGGQVRFGPDVEWIDEIDYAPRGERLASFERAIQSYYPALPGGSLKPVYSGIRPKIVGPGEPAADFRIDGSDVHGVAGLINLFGIESPGLTASLAIADRVSSLV